MVQPKKIEVVEKTSDRLRRAQSVVVVGYKGLTVADLQVLRRQLRETGSELRVIKNRLVKRALQEVGCAPLDTYLKGATALAFGYDDPTAPAKVCAKFAKTKPKLVICGGLLGREHIDQGKVDILAKMPGRTELLTQMAGTMLAPMRQMATAMNQAMSKIVYAMTDRAKQLEGAA